MNGQPLIIGDWKSKIGFGSWLLGLWLTNWKLDPIFTLSQQPTSRAETLTDLKLSL